MRLFVAVQLSEELKKSITGTLHDLKQKGVKGNYVPVKNLHLTLAFIGDYDDPDHVKSVIDGIRIRPFDITLSGIGAFGDLWWAGIEESAPLQAVVRRLRRALAEEGIPFDRKKFSPHITLIRRVEGRLSDESKDALSDRFDAAMNVDHISLMRSDRGKHGMIYTEL